MTDSATPRRGEQQSATPTKRVGFTEYNDDIENYGYCLRCSEWSFVPEQDHCPDCSAKNQFRKGEAAMIHAPDPA